MSLWPARAKADFCNLNRRVRKDASRPFKMYGFRLVIVVSSMARHGLIVDDDNVQWIAIGATRGRYETVVKWKNHAWRQRPFDAEQAGLGRINVFKTAALGRLNDDVQIMVRLSKALIFSIAVFI
jgi:hypothetical protein